MNKRFIRVTADVNGALTPILVNPDIITTVAPAAGAPGRSIIKTNAGVATERGIVPLDILVANSVDQLEKKLSGEA